MSKKKDARFEDEGTGLGESAPEVDPANFDVDATDDSEVSDEIDLSPATSSIAIVSTTETTVELVEQVKPL